jgi:hypothetical protein
MEIWGVSVRGVWLVQQADNTKVCYGISIPSPTDNDILRLAAKREHKTLSRRHKYLSTYQKSEVDFDDKATQHIFGQGQ